MESASKLWGGRFSTEAHATLAKLNNSLPVDKRLFDEDITGSLAYATALVRAELLTETECQTIIGALEEIREEWKTERIKFEPSDEDVHTVNERRLVELIGAQIGGKLHTGRSRNDQVATDMRLWMKKAIQEIQGELKGLIVDIICPKALQCIDVLMPGYTHLQRAQVIRCSHWLLSYAWYFQSDYQRFDDLLKRMDVMPLGSGAIAGNPFAIDREMLGKDLEFGVVSRNSMYAVGDRDFVAEFNFINSLTSVHMSRLAEDLIIFSSKEFGFVQISEAFSTGSSLMPQKRNPDSLELIRGISGEIFGQMAGFMMTLKGLPSTYNKDLQSDKKSMFECNDRLRDCLSVLQGVLATMQMDAPACERALSMDMLATDIAYYLVRKGLAFRTAHHVSGQVVKLAEENQWNLAEVPLTNLKGIHSLFEEDFNDIFDFDKSAEQYRAIGGTSKENIYDQVNHLENKFK